jgi:hypothetical protein
MRNYSNYSPYFYESTGHEFEGEVISILSAFARAEWGKDAVQFATEKQDKHEGTDLFILKTPIDVTLDFEQKNRMRKLGNIKLDGITIEFGIRFGNSKANFKTPVLVIGATSAVEITKSNMWYTLDVIKSHVRNILDVGMDKYFAVEA